jgi:hypothetical protein
MKKLLIVIATVCLVFGLNYGASAWIYVPDYGDTGWQTYAYTAGAAGFEGTAGFVVSNVKDTGAYSELLLDNLQGGGGTNPSFETVNFTGYTFVDELPQMSFGNVSDLVTAYSYTGYSATDGTYFADLQGLYIPNLPWGITTSQFHNGTGDAGTVGSILERGVTLAAGATFSFDWAFLAGDMSDWNDFALFYLKDQSGAIMFSEGLAQIGTAPAVPLPPSVLLLGSGLLGLVRIMPAGGINPGIVSILTNVN